MTVKITSLAILILLWFQGITTEVTSGGLTVESLQYFQFQLISDPNGSQYQVIDSGGVVHKGKTPLSKKLPAGPLTYKIENNGYCAENGKMYLKGNKKIYHCLNRFGQLVKCKRRIYIPVHSWTDKKLPRDERVGGPKSVMVSPDGNEIWVAMLVGPPSIRIYDIASGEEKATIKLGEFGAVEFAFSKDKSLVYVSQLESHAVYEIEIKTRKKLRQFETGGKWPKILELSADGHSLFVSNWISSNVSEINLKTGKIKRIIKTVKTPRGLFSTSDGKYLYVAGFGKGELQRINLITGKRKTLLKNRRALRHIVADNEQKSIFISEMGGNNILRGDVNSGNFKPWSRTCKMPNTIDLGQDDRLLFVSCRGKNNPLSYLDPGPEWGSVLIYDTTNKKVLDAIIQGNQPTALEFSPTSRLLVTSDFIDNRVNIYTVPTYEELKQGGGGRSDVYSKELVKLNWKKWKPTPSKKIVNLK